MSDPLVERLDHVGGKLTVVPGSRLRGRWMTDDFVAEYGPDVDLATVPRSVLLVPFAFNVAPVVWFSGERYVLDELDERAVESLAAIHRVLRGMYPDVAWNGELHVERAVPAPPPRPGLDEALLFSGGLDSTYSALSRPAEEQLLITMWGNDVDLSNAAGWAAVRADTEDFIDFSRTFSLIVAPGV